MIIVFSQCFLVKFLLLSVNSKHNFLSLLSTLFDSLSILLFSFAFLLTLSAASIATWSKLCDLDFVVLRIGFGGVRGFSFIGGGEHFTLFSIFPVFVVRGLIIVFGLSCSYSLKSSSSLLDVSLNTLYSSKFLFPASVLSVKYKWYLYHFVKRCSSRMKTHLQRFPLLAVVNLLEGFWAGRESAD